MTPTGNFSINKLFKKKQMKYSIMTFLLLTTQFVTAQITWAKSSSNLILTKTINLFEGTAVGSPSVIDEGDTLKMLYAAGGTDTKGRISYAYSLNGTTWTKYNNATPVFDVGGTGNWDSHFLDTPDWLKDGIGYKMYYFGDNDNNAVGGAIGLATSNDGVNWVRSSNQPILLPGNPGEWDGLYIESPSVLYDGVSYFMWYSGIDTSYQVKIGVATSPDGINWTKYAGNPVIDGGSIYSWEGFSVATPTIIKRNNQFEMWYCGVSYYDILDNSTVDTIKIGYATSTNGLNWTKHPANPVMSTYDNPYNINESRGPWTPDVVFRPLENKYYMWYETAYGFGLATANDNFLPTNQINSSTEIFNLYPNPFSSLTTLQTDKLLANATLTVYNSFGQTVQQIKNISGQTVTLSRDNLPSGLYLVRLTQDNKVIAIDKLVVSD